MEAPSKDKIPLRDDGIVDVEQLEQKLVYLASDKIITKARQVGEKLIEKADASYINWLRHRAKSDPFFLATAILGYDKLNTKFHGNFCKWLMSTRTNQFRETLLARGHLKSTIQTVTDTIRLHLPSQDPDNEIYPENLGADGRTLIAHEIAESASAFLFQITQHFLSTDLMVALFPECIPTPRKERISTKLLDLPRTSRWREGTISTMGVGGKRQGDHFNFIKCDDLIGREARDSKTVMDDAKNWINNLQSYLISPARDHIDFMGTRYKFDDAYQHIEEMYGSNLVIYRRGAEVIEDGKLVPIYPEQFTTQSLEILKKDKEIWASQYANDPALGAAEWDQMWLRWYVWNDRRVKYKDILTNQLVFHDVSDLDICILLDPAMGGKVGLLVTGMDEIGNIYILEAIKESLKAPEIADYIFKLEQKWTPRLVVIEDVLFSGTFEHWFRDRMRLTGRYFRVQSLPTGGRAKDLRVQGLASYFKEGRILFHPDQKDLILEFKQFGATDDYHMLDSLAQGPFVWRKGIASSRIKHMLESNSETENTIGQHPVGGY